MADPIEASFPETISLNELGISLTVIKYLAITASEISDFNLLEKYGVVYEKS